MSDPAIPPEQILQTMTTYGGSFVQQLALLYRRGDRINQRKLEVAFAGYFREYEALAANAGDAVMNRPLGTAPTTWQSAALRVGEELAAALKQLKATTPR